MYVRCVVRSYPDTKLTHSILRPRGRKKGQKWVFVFRVLCAVLRRFPKQTNKHEEGQQKTRKEKRQNTTQHIKSYSAPRNRLLALLSYPIWKSLKKRLNPEKYNGAMLLGLRGVVVKSHGGVSVAGFESALELAVGAAEQDVASKIALQLEQSDISME